MPWRTQVVRDARVMVCLLRKGANREWNEPKSIAVKKVERMRSEENFNIRHRNAEFVVCPACPALFQNFLIMPSFLPFQ